jgi:uncharacterized lipoprotein YddW (UPF0748 family)
MPSLIHVALAGRDIGLHRRLIAMLFRPLIPLLFVALSVLALGATPPVIPREFRGMWIASVGNKDWPSKPGLPVAQQQAELRLMIEGARRLNLNVVLLQVRPAADALYESAFEPWSEYLSGRMGQAPQQSWDPLRFAVQEAHARGLELHAWVNPFRVRYQEAISPVSPSHISKTHPEWVRQYGKLQILDPGEPEARDYVIKVLTDIVRRYDIDGLHIDDYFYPYPENAPGTSTPMEFDDQRTYRRYRTGGGNLDRPDWRRDNVNVFVKGLNDAVHGTKPWVKFGISPFGIWRPKNPEGVRGLDAYGTLYADAKLWMESGWADYFAPQLYWALDRKDQDFKSLLRWWSEQNPNGRLLVPGLKSAGIGQDRQADDIANQIRIVREHSQANGVIFWNASSLRDNLGGIASALSSELFARPALVPEASWLGTTPPAAPGLRAVLGPNNSNLRLNWSPGKGDPVRRWVLFARNGAEWRHEILPPGTNEWVFDIKRERYLPDEVQLVGVGRTGILGDGAGWARPVSSRPASVTPKAKRAAERN